MEIKKGSFVQFMLAGARCDGFRIGKVLKMSGNKVTVLTAPFTLRGSYTGRRIRVSKEEIYGIVFRKKVRPLSV
jgi:hypothetical protein